MVKLRLFVALSFACALIVGTSAAANAQGNGNDSTAKSKTMNAAKSMKEPNLTATLVDPEKKATAFALSSWRYWPRVMRRPAP